MGARLRGYDAVQLASALTWRGSVGEEIVVVMFDQQLCEAARRTGSRYGRKNFPGAPAGPTPAARTGRRAVTMKPAEALAKRIIESVEAGARMVYREDQRVRTHDFDLHRTAGRVVAVEVTSITDGVVRATYAAIDRCRQIPRSLCTRDWRIHPATDAVIKRIAEHGDAYLARIEADGVEQFFAPGDGSMMSSVEAIGATSASSAAERFPGRSPVSASRFPSLAARMVRIWCSRRRTLSPRPVITGRSWQRAEPSSGILRSTSIAALRPF